MNTLLCAVLIVVVSTLISANPVFKEASFINDDDTLNQHIPKTYLPAKVEPLKHSRSQRSPQIDPEKLKVFAQGSHSRQAGTDLYVQGQARVWQSQNKLNDFHVQGNYGQHFGGPGGRSPPSFGGGITYTRRF